MPVCLPIPSNIPEADSDSAARFRRTLTQAYPNAKIVGHFGTFGGAIRELTFSTLNRLLSSYPNFLALLIGRGSQQAAVGLQQLIPESANRSLQSRMLQSRK